jgi:hypothetical protein
VLAERPAIVHHGFVGQRRRHVVSGMLTTLLVLVVVLLRFNSDEVRWGSVPGWICAISLAAIAGGVWFYALDAHERGRSEVDRSRD